MHEPVPAVAAVVQDWQVIREKVHKGVLYTGMGREAEPQPGLPVRVMDDGVPALS